MMRRLRSEAGITLIETTIACSILLVAMLGLLSMGAIATRFTENHGHLEARTTEYAQDKMEQLLALAYTDASSNTVVFPAAASGGTGLTVGGSSNPDAPVTGYVDWLGADGGLLGGGTTQPAGWQYQRVWLVESPSTGIKRLTVVSRVRLAVGKALPPQSTVVAVKAAQF